MKRIDLILNLQPTLLARRDRLRQSLSGELALHVYDEDESCDDQVFSQLSLSESKEIAEIEEALQRMSEGRYGVCEECGRNIPLTRIKALPYASTCIQCQRDSECASASHRVRQAEFVG